MHFTESPIVAKILLFAAFFILGFYFINAQVILVQEFLVVLFGNELCIGAIMASWFMGMTIGAWISSYLADRIKSFVKAYFWSQIAMCIILPLQFYLIRILRNTTHVPQGETIPFFTMILSTLFITFPFSFLVGFIFPFACRVLSSFQEKKSVAVGLVYLTESLGGLVGGIAFSFWLVTHYHPFAIVSFQAVLLLVIIILCLRVFYKKIDLKIGITAFALVIINFLISFTPLGNSINHYTVVKRWKGFNDKLKLEHYTDSKYQHISIGLQEDQHSLFGNGTYISSFPDEYSYAVKAHFILAQHPQPRSVLLIGGGVEGLIREIIKHDIKMLDYVELDPKLIAAVKRYLPVTDRKLLKDSRVRLHYVDGRQFIKLTEDKYDMIILNLPDPSTAMINRFYTFEFFQEAKSKLRSKGVLVSQMSSAINYVGGEIGDYAGSLYYTLHQVFPYVLVVPNQIHYYFAANSPGIITSDVEVLAKRFEDAKIETPYFNRYTFEYMLQPERLDFIERSLREKEDKELNTDNQPVTYFFNLIIWNQLTSRIQQAKVRGTAERLFIAIRQLKLRWMLFPIIIFAVVRILVAVFRRQFIAAGSRFNILFAVATTGFTAMAIEIILIFAFQNIFGYIYQKLGLIVAVFMFGLAIGSWVMNHSLKKPIYNPKKEAFWRKWLLAFELAIFIFCLLLPPILKLFSTIHYAYAILEYLFTPLLFIIGILTGIEFPLVTELYLSLKGKQVGKASGMVDGADNFGAFFGAILTGIIFAPLLGIAKTCWLLSTIKGVSLLFLISAFLFSGRIRAD
jgi:spermidine synthase